MCAHQERCKSNFQATFAGQRGSATSNKLASYKSSCLLLSPFYSAPALVGAYQIGAKSILEPNLHGRVSLCPRPCRYPEAVTTIARPGRYRAKQTAHKCLPSWFRDHSAPDPPFDARSGFSRGMPRSFSGAETRGRWTGGSCICMWEEKRPVGCGRSHVSIPSS